MLKTLIFTTALSSTLHAASLVWTDTAFTNANQIDTVGTLVVGYNFGTGTDVTVNGVTFTGYNTTGAFTGSNFQPGAGSITANFDPAYGGHAVTGMTATEITNFLSTANYGSGGASTKFTGLTNGQQYLAQLLLVDNRASFTGRNMHISENGSTWDGGASILVDYTSNGAPPYARLIETTFTADSTEQTFRWGIQNVGDYEGLGLQLRAIPEPSSTALIGLAGLGFLIRRR